MLVLLLCRLRNLNRLAPARFPIVFKGKARSRYNKYPTYSNEQYVGAPHASPDHGSARL